MKIDLCFVSKKMNNFPWRIACDQLITNVDLINSSGESGTWYDLLILQLNGFLIQIVISFIKYH